MKKVLKFLQLIFLLMLIFVILFPIVFAQEVKTQEIKTTFKKPLPPPVEIMFFMKSIPKVGEELTLKMRVIPLKDMPAEISCFLPEGIKPVREKGVTVQSYGKRNGHKKERKMKYRYAMGLWIGPLKAKVTKEFYFRVIILDKGKYELIACVDVLLAKWGVKEEILKINIK
ncbi:MAG: hypothetical protein AB1755_06595 [Candidatus Omnitrophota bacterium]